MNYQRKPIVQQSATRATDIDFGLRAFMLKVYNFMGLALILTGLVAYSVASTPQLVAAIYGTPLRWAIVFMPFILALFFSFRIQRMSYQAAQALFWVYAASLGVSLSWIFLMYTGESVARVFFVTAATFGGMSLYGYTTQRDLTSFGSFFIMGVIGLFIASLVNIFMQSDALGFAISVIGVLVFVGLTAFYTQEIRQSYLEQDDKGTAGKKALFGALMLYMAFVNLFISLLRLFGDRR